MFYFNVLLVIIIVLILYTIHIDFKKKNAKKMIYGLWNGDKDFLESSGLSDGILFIDDDTYMILIDDESNELYNDVINFNINFNSVKYNDKITLTANTDFKEWGDIFIELYYDNLLTLYKYENDKKTILFVASKQFVC